MKSIIKFSAVFAVALAASFFYLFLAATAVTWMALVGIRAALEIVLLLPGK